MENGDLILKVSKNVSIFVLVLLKKQIEEAIISLTPLGEVLNLEREVFERFRSLFREQLDYLRATYVIPRLRAPLSYFEQVLNKVF